MTHHSASANTPAKPLVHASAPFEHQHSISPPTVIGCDIEQLLFLAALSDTRVILKNLAELRATRVSKETVKFLSKYEVFAPLLARLTKNYWISLTDEEKSHRSKLRHQSDALKREQELLDGIAVRKKIATKFFQAHQLHMPIRLSQVELMWLERNPESLTIVSVKSTFLLPSSHNMFDFSDEAFARLAARLRFEMLTPDDVNVLNSHGAPMLPDNTLSLDDSRWAREPYAKAVLYRLVKYRKDEEAAQIERMKNTSIQREKSFKRIYLSEDDPSSNPINIRSNQDRDTDYITQPHATTTITSQSFNRIELDCDETVGETINIDEPLRHRWIEAVKGKVISLFRISVKTRAFAG